MAARIVLVAIMKNESLNIEPLFESVKHIVDAIVILDTGSTDDTLQVLENQAARIQKPIKVGHEPFVNFGVSRTASYQLATRYVEAKKWPLEETYALFLDADSEIYEVYTKDSKTRVSVEAMTTFKTKLLQEKPKALFNVHSLDYTSYVRVGLVRMDHPWVCKNACHEYWDGPVDPVTQKCPWTVFEKPTGGNKATKLEREAKLLEDDIASGNRTPRNLFYYGRALDSLKKTAEAVTILEECVRESKWAEERYEARLILARIWALRSQEATLWPHAHEVSMNHYWAAHHDMPARGEALYFVAFHHRSRKEYLNALHVLRIALEDVEMPREQKPGLLQGRPNVAWTSFVASLFGLSANWFVQGSKRTTSLFQNLDIVHDRLFEELALNALAIQDPDWRIRGIRAAEWLYLNAKTEKSQKVGAEILKAIQQQPA